MNSLSQLELSSISFFGRSLAEYTRFLALEPAALRGRTVLDVAAGPASFTAEANRLGIHATAVDPLYGLHPETLTSHVQLDYAHMGSQMHARGHLFELSDPQSPGSAFYSSIAAAVADRREAAERFLEDYRSGFVQGRYVGGSLPALAFPDRVFDLVLCAHLLFLYPKHFNFAAHLAACRELVRVSRQEVRIHPLCGTDGLPYPEFDRLRHELHAAGIASEVVPVPYAFFKGANTLLRLQRQ